MTLMASDDAGDIEVGCQVWSDTHQDSRGQVGGIVVRVAVNGDGEREFTVVRSCPQRLGPVTARIPESELRMAATSWLTRDAATVAGQIHAWIGSLKASERREQSSWARVALDLDVASERGYTPRMEARYRAELDARREARA